MAGQEKINFAAKYFDFTTYLKTLLNRKYSKFWFATVYRNLGIFLIA